MKNKLIRWWLEGVAILFFTFLLLPQQANATAQWARKYQMNCQTCHTSFPRLTYFGEKFARNGYQLPDTQDGDETKEAVGDHLFIDKIGNLLGMRISVSPVEATTNTLNIDGSRKDFEFNFGDTKWLQFFTAGSIFKNASIFIETEIEPTAVHLNWFTLGYHNLFDSSLLNVRAGRISMMNWHAQSGRLRMIPNVNVASHRFRPSQGANRAVAEEPIRISSPVPGIELYGYREFFLYSVGVSNGEDMDDPNQYKNFFGTLRFDLPEGELAGSNISGWGMWGRDTVNSGAESTPIAQTRNTFYRLSPAVNVRWKGYDLIGAYVYGKEDNYNLVDPEVTNKSHGATGQLGYLIHPQWFAALQYDFVKDDQNSRDEFHKISESVSFMPRENMRIGLTLREDMKKPTTGRQHELLLNVRSMF
ncbi:MAG: hypothetical protein HYT76_01085 [Deltaproteobacteria bacterium]|nr:hypothetical protein [Deltaproteobacteria bacterium]